MLATPGSLPSGPGWVYEVKWDGMRVLADVADGRLRLHGRSGREVTDNFPELASLTWVAPDLLVDGEVVLLDGGVPSFAALAERIHRPVSAARARARLVTFMAFDVLRLYGVWLFDRPLDERRATLERLDLSLVPAVGLSPLYSDGAALLAATAARGMEGIVAKRRDSPYRPGWRSPSWVKVSHRYTQSLLVGGWRPERGGAARIGALLLGVPGPDGGLRYAGRVGSGLAGGAVQRVLGALLSQLVVADPPFAVRPPRTDAAGARWCEPLIVVEVAHLGWTDGDRLRQPVLRGVRDDVEPGEVRREP
ncbi:non-homologous end-joining DNA ligase [Pseudonocardia asaccharolytica]|nr:non-homologous end-joining DNA ligase [Pseudonocardia asaccharolytica]